MSIQALALSAILSLFATAPAIDRPPDVTALAPKESTISATRTARVEPTPDYVDVMVGAVAIEKTAGAANAAATKIMEAAVTAIKTLKLTAEDLQTGSVGLDPRYERKNNPEDDVPKIVGYVATVTLRVRTSDLKSVPRIIDAALGANCNRVDYVQFGIKEAIAAREEAVKLATQAARRKAVVMADALDLHITRVVDASTSSQQRGGWYGTANQISQMSNQSFEAPSARGDSTESVVPGKIEVWADATITFGAAPGK